MLVRLHPRFGPLPGRLLLLVAGWLLAPSAFAATNAPSFRDFMAKRGYDAVPLVRNPQQQLVAQGKLNDRKADFLVDTGFSFTTVESAEAKKLPSMDAALIAGSLPPRLAGAPLVLIDRLTLGPREFREEMAQVRSWRSGAGLFSRLFQSDALDADAVLGANFLRREQAVIDYGSPPTLFLRATPRDAATAAGMDESFTRSGFQAVPIEFFMSSCWLVRLTVNDTPMVLLFDTGAFWTLIDDRTASELKIMPDQPAAQIRGVEKRRADLRSTDARVRLGGVDFGLSTLGIAHLGEWSLGGDDAPRGVLGADLLMRGRAIIDCAAAKLWLMKPK